MRYSKWIAIGLFGAGVLLVVISMYIKSQVADGERQIAGAQESVDRGRWLFSLFSGTRSVGDGLTAPFQSKIDAGSEQVAYYAALSNWLMTGGILCLAAGGGLVAYEALKRK